jgi:hypothetical protein
MELLVFWVIRCDTLSAASYILVETILSRAEACRDNPTSPGERVMNSILRRFKMWIFRYLVCLMDNHSFIEFTWKNSPYQYCLRCGRVEAQDLAKESIRVEGGEIMRAN